MGTDEATLLRLWREKRGETEPEALSNNLVAGDSRLSEIAVGPSLAFTVPPHAEALPPAFINELDSSSLKRSLDCFDGFFGNLTPLFFKVDDG
jgi:hypothetical protein